MKRIAIALLALFVTSQANAQVTSRPATPTNFAGGSVALQAINTTNDYPYSGSINQALTTDANSEQPVSVPGKFSALYAQVSAAPGAGQTVTFTLRVNGASPSNGPTCQLTSAAVTCNDLTHSASVSAGDLVDMQVVFSATATTARHSFSTRFDPQP